MFGLVFSSYAVGTTYYVDQNHPSCSDSGNGSQATPWCSFVPTQTHLQAGDTVLIANGRYGDYVPITRYGDEGNPITFQATGDSVVVGTFYDVVDEGFVQTSDLSLVWEISLPPSLTVDQPRVFQTYFTPIVVDDPNNGSNFTLSETDGPISLTSDGVTTTSQVELLEGSFLVLGRTLYVHPYGNRTPSTGATDFVFGNRRHGTFELSSNAHDLVFDGLTFSYSTPYNTSINGTRIVARNIRATHGFRIEGDGNRLEHYIGVHSLYREIDGDYTWYDQASGDGLAVFGSNNVVDDATMYHNWNGMSDGGTNNNLNRITIHGASNHCWYVQGAQSQVRNLLEYNCQDYQYLWMNDGFLLENSTIPTAVLLEWNEIPMANDFVYRNNVFSTPGPRFFNWTGPTPPDCSFESKTVFENNLIFVIRHLQFSQNTKIAHCEGSPQNKVFYLLDDYIAKCASGELVNCATFRNNVLLDAQSNPPATVLAGGDWTVNQDQWDYHLLNGSNAAVDQGSSDATGTVDLQGEPRPQGLGYDIGADEWAVGGDNDAPILDPIGNKTIDEGASLTFLISSADPDGPIPSVTANNLPDGASFADRGDGTGAFSWSPSYADAGVYSSVTFRTTDGQLFDSETITITVEDASQPCVPNWSCGEWGACSDSLQSRTCTDANACGTDAGKPSEVQACDATPPETIDDLQFFE
jgi:hypothetical protein